MESPFFYMSLLIGRSFTFVQNAERSNEIFLKFEGMEPESKEDSGIALFNFILEYMDKNMHDP